MDGPDYDKNDFFLKKIEIWSIFIEKIKGVVEDRLL